MPDGYPCMNQNDQLDFIKIINFCLVANRMKRQATGREKIRTKHLSDKELEQKIFKMLTKFNIRKKHEKSGKVSKQVIQKKKNIQTDGI